MPVSQKQLEANRKNAQKSTGPKTERGKKTSSRNAVKHGLYSGDRIIDSPALKENREEYESIYKTLLDEFKPEGELEHCLVHRMASCLWRGHRAVRAEKKLIEVQLQNEDRIDSTLPPDQQVGDRLDRLALAYIPSEHFNMNLSRYEACLDRRLSQTFSLLSVLQKRRMKKAAAEKP